MNREVNKLIKDIGKENKDIYNKLVSIANKTVRRKNYLVIDVMEMESMVDDDKVGPAPSIERVEVEA
jgi:hypothetical protein